MRHEVELLRATGLDNRKELSFIPLYYAARALKTQKKTGNVQLGDRAIADVKAAMSLGETLANKFGMDEDRGTRNALGGLLSAT